MLKMLSLKNLEIKTVNKKIAKKIVDEIIKDLTDRSGLQNVWDSIDDECKEDIKDEWVNIIICNSKE